ncbi:MAG: hypothetical protein JWR69_1524, partial [Pedosphaera sp.]|nr:hypothetical protein [Pedosphaera sp.]
MNSTKTKSTTSGRPAKAAQVAGTPATGPARPGVIQGERPGAGSDSALDMLDAKLSQRKVSNAPLCKTFKEF